jgi:Fe2+ or Zn2+ uptake regulation protein
MRYGSTNWLASCTQPVSLLMLMPHSDKIEIFSLLCKSDEIRITAKCQVLLRIFCRIDHFIDAESLWLVIKNEGQQISRATVYKSLSWLCSNGYAKYKKDKNAGFKVYRLNDTGQFKDG